MDNEIFKRYVSVQIGCSRIAIDMIEANRDDLSLINFAIQSLLSSLANISKVFYNGNNIKNADGSKNQIASRANERATDLLTFYKLDVKTFPTISAISRTLRNTSEHYDQRIDEYIDTFPNHVFIDLCVLHSGAEISNLDNQTILTANQNERLKCVFFTPKTINPQSSNDDGKVKFVYDAPSIIMKKIDYGKNTIEYLGEKLDEPSHKININELKAELLYVENKLNSILPID